MRKKTGLLILFIIFIALFSSSAFATTLFSDQFSDKNPLDLGWTGDYFDMPYADSNSARPDIRSDLFTLLKSGSEEDYIVEINNYATMIQTINTTGYENITLRYCRSTTTLADTTAQLKIGWKFGEHHSALLNTWSRDENWSEWNQLEAVDMGYSRDCKEFPLGSSEEQGNISIAFFFDGKRKLHNGINYQAGYVDEVLLAGDVIPPPNSNTNSGGGGGGGGGSDGGSKGAGTTIIPSTAPPAPPACVEDWICQEWTACVDGTQTRFCGDRNNCGTSESKPETEQVCTATIAAAEQQPTPGFFAGITGAVIGPNGAPTALGFLLLLTLILALYFLMKTFRKGKVEGKKGRMGKRARMGKRGRR